MVAMRQIREVGQRIGKRFHPQRVILFGSYAYGRPTEDSDVDLLVVMPGQGSTVDQSVEIRMAIRPSFPVDLLVRTSEKLQERLDMGDSFVRTILDEGKVLYEADQP
jgi:predicted nucleotidyltransferase